MICRADPTGLTTYSCEVTFNLILKHKYLCVDGICGGQAPEDGTSKPEALFSTSPGSNSGGPAPQSEGGSAGSGSSPGDGGAVCTKVKTKKKKCLENCTIMKLAGPRPPNSVFGNGTDCGGFVDQTLDTCKSKCNDK